MVVVLLGLLVGSGKGKWKGKRRMKREGASYREI